MRLKTFFALLLFYSFLFHAVTLTFADTDSRQLTQSRWNRDETPMRVLFINQVRGEECCDSGSVSNLEKQIETFKMYNLPATFTLRYDALTNSKYVDLLTSLPLYSGRETRVEDPRREGGDSRKEGFEYGLFLEITPSLARAAGVEYKGSSDSVPMESGRDSRQPASPAGRLTTHDEWYQAQHAYTIGYTIEDRKKLIDTAMGKFKSTFGYYPKTTTAWMMDTDSLNYMRDTYGVTTHQITREQWGVDSYTMDGGPVHYPYYADRNWAFLPKTSLPFTGENPESTTVDPGSEGLLVLRQTISDPLRNFGDDTSAFTSQPNDYARDGKTLDYFKQLILQSLHQTQNPYSIAILGLENSMADTFQEDFQDQIEFIAQLKNEKSDSDFQIQTASQFTQEFDQKWKNETITTLVGKDLINSSHAQTVWINTPYFRARILKNGEQVMLTDYRIYADINPQLTTNNLPRRQAGSQLNDPYNNYQAQKLGYWVTPFVFNSARFYATTTEKTIPIKQKIKDAIKQRVLPEFTYKEATFSPLQNDTNITPIGLALPDIAENEMFTISSNALEYKNAHNEITQLIWQEKSLSIQSKNIEKNLQLFDGGEESPLPLVETHRGNSRLISWDNGGVNLEITCQKQQCTLVPNIADHFSFEHDREQYYPYLFPEVVTRTLSEKNTILYAHNQYAIAGKNPVRFVLIPRDEQDYAIATDLIPQISSEPSLSETLIQTQQGTSGIIFIDAIDQRVGKYTVTVNVGKEVEKTVKIYFAPDCKKEKLYCLTHPRQTTWYLKSMIITKLRNI